MSANSRNVGGRGVGVAVGVEAGAGVFVDVGDKVGVKVAVSNGVFVGAGVTVDVGARPQADKAKPKDAAPLNLRKSRRVSFFGLSLAITLSNF
jgi:hypothetical protein